MPEIHLPYIILASLVLYILGSWTWNKWSAHCNPPIHKAVQTILDSLQTHIWDYSGDPKNFMTVSFFRGGHYLSCNGMHVYEDGRLTILGQEMKINNSEQRALKKAFDGIVKSKVADRIKKVAEAVATRRKEQDA